MTRRRRGSKRSGKKRAPKPPRHRPDEAPGRNDPCPCGSGLKLKRCCAATKDTLQSLHDLDNSLREQIFSAVAEEYGPLELQDAFEQLPGDPFDSNFTSLHGAWIAYHEQVADGRRFVDVFLEKVVVTPEERSLLEAQREAWLTIWEVQGVKRGHGIELLDRLTGEQRYVHEVTASQSATLGMHICGRVVRYGQVHVLAGIHPKPLSPSAAERVVEDLCETYECTSEPPFEVGDLQGEIGAVLLAVWHDEVHEVFAAPSPILRNTDGEQIAQTADTFSLEGSPQEVVQRLLTMEGVEEDHESGPNHFVVVRAEDQTLLGALTVEEDQLRIETNSETRADGLRARVEEACAGLVSHRQREVHDLHQELLERLQEQLDQGSPPPEAAARPAGADEAILAFKRNHYATWGDEPLPALDGLTARQALAQGGKAAKRVEVLLREIEHDEAREPRGTRYDVGELRANLGLS